MSRFINYFINVNFIYTAYIIFMLGSSFLNWKQQTLALKYILIFFFMNKILSEQSISFTQLLCCVSLN